MCNSAVLCQSTLSCFLFFFFFSSRRRHTRCSRDWSSDVCSSDLGFEDMMRRVPSIEKLYALTGFRPQTSLNEIIDRVAEHFRQKNLGLADLSRVATANAD